jgi:hypothetical protein
MAFRLRSVREPGGTTLVEAVITLGIVAVLVVTMATLIALGREMTMTTRRDTMALALARDRLEQLGGLAFSTYALASGGRVEVTDLVTDLSTELPGVGGPGLSTGPTDALIEPRPGYVDYLDSEGQWVGNDALASFRSSFTRRWTVRRIGVGPTEIVAFEVMVAPVAVALRTRGSHLLQQPGVVRLIGVRSRRAV